MKFWSDVAMVKSKLVLIYLHNLNSIQHVRLFLAPVWTTCCQIWSFYLQADSWDHFCGQSEGQYSPIVGSSTSPSLIQLFLFLTGPSARSFLKYQVNFQHKLNFSYLTCPNKPLCSPRTVSETSLSFSKFSRAQLQLFYWWKVHWCQKSWSHFQKLNRSLSNKFISYSIL